MMLEVALLKSMNLRLLVTLLVLVLDSREFRRSSNDVYEEQLLLLPPPSPPLLLISWKLSQLHELNLGDDISLRMDLLHGILIMHLLLATILSGEHQE